MASTRLPAEGKQRKTAWKNQRATVRYRCAPATAGRVYLSADMEYQRAWIQDLSKSGVGLWVNKPLDPGLFVTIHLKAPGSKKCYELPGHVIHATCQSGNDWIIGCELLTPLSRDDLDDLLC